MNANTLNVEADFAPFLGGRTLPKVRGPGRPKNSNTGHLAMKRVVVESYASLVNVDPDDLISDSRNVLDAYGPERWPLDKDADLINGDFMRALARRLPFQRGDDGKLLDPSHAENMGAVALAIVGEGSIVSGYSDGKENKKKNPTIVARVTIAQQNVMLLEDLQVWSYPFHGYIPPVSKEHHEEDTERVEAARFLVFDGAWAVGVLAHCYDKLSFKKKQALLLARLYFHGMFFGHPRNRGWPDWLWHYRRQLALEVSWIKGGSKGRRAAKLEEDMEAALAEERRRNLTASTLSEP